VIFADEAVVEQQPQPVVVDIRAAAQRCGCLSGAAVSIRTPGAIVGQSIGASFA
jgi:hypothetical protein